MCALLAQGTGCKTWAKLELKLEPGRVDACWQGGFLGDPRHQRRGRPHGHHQDQRHRYSVSYYPVLVSCINKSSPVVDFIYYIPLFMVTCYAAVTLTRIHDGAVPREQVQGGVLLGPGGEQDKAHGRDE